MSDKVVNMLGGGVFDCALVFFFLVSRLLQKVTSTFGASFLSGH